MGPSGRKRHIYKLGGYKMKFSTRAKGRIPGDVVEYLLSDNKIWEEELEDQFKGAVRGAPKLDTKVRVCVETGENPRGNNLGGEPVNKVGNTSVVIAPRLLRPKNRTFWEHVIRRATICS
jgi:hypothetical protein